MEENRKELMKTTEILGQHAAWCYLDHFLHSKLIVSFDPMGNEFCKTL